MEDREFDRIWRVVEEIGVQERHFNELQSDYRKMASAWLGATFAGLGFALGHAGELPVPKQIAVAGVALSGAVGVALLGGLDLLVYHQLLNACFVEGLILERANPWLPPIRRNMLATQGGRDIPALTREFYLVPTVLLVLIAGAAVSWWAKDRVGWIAAVGCAAAAAAAAGLVVVVAAARTRAADAALSARFHDALS